MRFRAGIRSRRYLTSTFLAGSQSVGGVRETDYIELNRVCIYIQDMRDGLLKILRNSSMSRYES